MNKKIIAAAVSVIAIASLAAALPAFAQISSSAYSPSTTGSVTGTASSTRHAAALEQHQQNVENRIQKGMTNGGKEIQNRIDALNKLLLRIQGMKNLSVTQKASFATTIQTSVTNMTNLLTKIQSDTSTTTLKADLQSIAPDYRIYMLVMPQISILSATDRVNTLVTSFQTIQTKIQARLATDATANANTSVQSALTDITAKLTDATTQSTAASNEVSGLIPDNGVKTVQTSNTAALKDAQSKIKAANKDLQAARKDVQTIVNVLIKDLKSMTNASSTGQ